VPAHLHQPRPDAFGRRVNSDPVSDLELWRRNDAITWHRRCPLEAGRAVPLPKTMHRRIPKQQRGQPPPNELPADGAGFHCRCRETACRQPARRASSDTTAMPTATAPKITCKMLGPRNGICTSSSIASSALATRAAVGAQTDLRQASHAASPDGRATLRNNHPAGNAQLDSPSGLSTEVGGVATPARS